MDRHAGPLFNYSDTWQLAINTATTIITFLMVFLIQHTQNIDSQAVQIKLDELIRATKGAHNALLDLEEMTEKQLDEIRMKYEFLAKVAKRKLRTEEDDLGSPDVGLQDSEETPLAPSNRMATANKSEHCRGLTIQMPERERCLGLSPLPQHRRWDGLQTTRCNHANRY